MNKRYDLDAESAYSQSTGTFPGKFCSRSLTDVADASYETSAWETISLRERHSRNLIHVDVTASQGKKRDHWSYAGRLWHRRRAVLMLLSNSISTKYDERHGKSPIKGVVDKHA